MNIQNQTSIQTIFQVLHQASNSPNFEKKNNDSNTNLKIAVEEKLAPLTLLKPSSSILQVIYPWVYGLIQPQDPKEDFRTFETFLEGKTNPKILFLSEGKENDVFNSHPLADIVARRLPQVNVIQADSSYPSPEQKHENIRKIHLDNSGSWNSLKNEEFDVVVMRNGLCCCLHPKSVSCAGIEMTLPAVFEFLQRIVKLLHKTCLSLAVLHGVVSEGRLITLWGTACANLKKFYPCVHVYLIPDEFNRLFAILIKTIVHTKNE